MKIGKNSIVWVNGEPPKVSHDGEIVSLEKRCICRMITEDGKHIRTMAWVNPRTLEHYGEWHEEDTDDA